MTTERIILTYPDSSGYINRPYLKLLSEREVVETEGQGGGAP
jgi:hypothetical protein